MYMCVWCVCVCKYGVCACVHVCVVQVDVFVWVCIHRDVCTYVYIVYLQYHDLP